jgi:hypothetical protein
MSALDTLYWSAFCVLATALLLFIIIRCWLRNSPPPDDTDYSDGI